MKINKKIISLALVFAVSLCLTMSLFAADFSHARGGDKDWTFFRHIIISEPEGSSSIQVKGDIEEAYWKSERNGRRGWYYKDVKNVDIYLLITGNGTVHVYKTHVKKGDFEFNVPKSLKGKSATVIYLGDDRKYKPVYAKMTLNNQRYGIQEYYEVPEVRELYSEYVGLIATNVKVSVTNGTNGIEHVKVEGYLKDSVYGKSPKEVYLKLAGCETQCRSTVKSNGFFVMDDIPISYLDTSAVLCSNGGMVNTGYPWDTCFRGFSRSMVLGDGSYYERLV